MPANANAKQRVLVDSPLLFQGVQDVLKVLLQVLGQIFSVQVLTVGCQHAAGGTVYHSRQPLKVGLILASAGKEQRLTC